MRKALLHRKERPFAGKDIKVCYSDCAVVPIFGERKKGIYDEQTGIEIGHKFRGNGKGSSLCRERQ